MRIRVLAYSIIAFLLFVLPWIPLPFEKPQVLHAIFGSHSSALLRFASFLCFLATAVLLIIWVLIVRVRRKVWDLEILTEGSILLALPFASVLVASAVTALFPPLDIIVHTNQSRESSAFVNPYLGYVLFDCTSTGTEYDQVFIPSHIGYQDVDFVSHAPRRMDKSISYLFGRKEGDWYLDHKGSVWEKELWECTRGA